MSQENILGVVAEYNPFHLGHAYQISAAKDKVHARGVVAVMSGNFTQRGDIACLDKWQRSQLALAGGADLVLELPAIYALRSSECFGSTAVALLAATGVVTHLVFGCETAQPEILAKLAQEDITTEKLAPYLKAGLTYGAAVSSYLATKEPAAKKLLQGPNNILALAYYQALKKYHLQAVPLKRKGAAYRDNDFTQEFPSAQSLREEIYLHGLTPQLSSGFPPEVWQQLATMTPSRVHEEILLPLLKHLCSTTSASTLALSCDASEGLENKLKAAAKAQSLEEFYQLVKSKRYPQTRLQRLVYQLLLSTEDALFATTKGIAPSYLRVLGFNATGRQLLKLMKKKATLPLITKLHKNELALLAKPSATSLTVDIAATNLYDLLKNTGSFNRDYTTGPYQSK